MELTLLEMLKFMIFSHLLLQYFGYCGYRSPGGGTAGHIIGAMTPMLTSQAKFQTENHQDDAQAPLADIAAEKCEGNCFIFLVTVIKKTTQADKKCSLLTYRFNVLGSTDEPFVRRFKIVIFLWKLED